MLLCMPVYIIQITDMKETPMEDVVRNILNDADDMLTYDEIEDEIHSKTQEAIRLLKSKGELRNKWRITKSDRKVYTLSHNYEEEQ